MSSLAVLHLLRHRLEVTRYATTAAPRLFPPPRQPSQRPPQNVTCATCTRRGRGSHRSRGCEARFSCIHHERESDSPERSGRRSRAWVLLVPVRRRWGSPNRCFRARSGVAADLWDVRSVSRSFVGWPESGRKLAQCGYPGGRAPEVEVPGFDRASLGAGRRLPGTTDCLAALPSNGAQGGLGGFPAPYRCAKDVPSLSRSLRICGLWLRPPAI